VDQLVQSELDEGLVNKKNEKQRELSTSAFLDMIGVARLGAHTSPFDPGYDTVTTESHIEQSGHLMSMLKISMACWLVADESSTRRKFSAAKRAGVGTVTGGGPFEIAVAQDRLQDYLDLCSDVGADRIECGAGFTDMERNPREIVGLAEARGLDVQFELGKKHGGTFDNEMVSDLIDQGAEWLDAGAKQIVIEGREVAADVGLFNHDGSVNREHADRFVEAFGLDRVIFEAPTKPSQFALLNHFGNEVELCNVRLEELLRVEIYRRGIHSDAFRIDKLRPKRVV
jgi:phosphosulfolactate synthase